MNQTQRLIDSIRDAPHDAVIVAGMFAVSRLVIVLLIVNRMRHPERGLLQRAGYRQRGIRCCAMRYPVLSSSCGSAPGGDSMQATVRLHLPIRLWLLGLAPLDTKRTTSRKAYEGSCRSNSSPRPSIRSSG